MLVLSSEQVQCDRKNGLKVPLEIDFRKSFPAVLLKEERSSFFFAFLLLLPFMHMVQEVKSTKHA